MHTCWEVGIHTVLLLILTYFIGLERGPLYCQQHNIDSLLLEMTHASTDSVRISTEIRLANAFMAVDIEKVRIHASSAHAAATSSGFERLAGHAEFMLGKYYDAMRQVDSAALHFGRALEFIDPLEDTTMIVWSNFGLCTALNSMRRYAASIEPCRQCITGLRRQSMRPHLAYAHRLLGIAYESEGTYDHALRAHQASMDISLLIGDTVSAGWATVNIGSLYGRKGDNERAERFWQQGLDIFSRFNITAGALWCLKSLGSLYFAQAQYAKALTYCERSLELSYLSNDTSLIVEALNVQAKILKGMGEHEESRNAYRSAIAFSRQLDHDYLLAHSLHGMGLLHGSLREWSDMLRYLYEAIEISEQGGATAQAMEIRSSAAIAQLALEQYAEAEMTVRKCLEYHLRTGDTNLIEKDYDLLGKIAQTQGQDDEALRYQLECLSLARRAGAIRREAAVLCAIGSLYAAQHESEKSIRHYSEALGLYRSLGITEREAVVLSSLSRILLEQKRYEESLRYVRESFALFESLTPSKTQEYGAARAAMAQADIYEAMDSLTRALTYYELARLRISAMDRANQQSLLPECEMKTGSVYLALGRYSDAIGMLESCLERLDADYDATMYQEVLEQLHDAYAGAQNYKEAYAVMHNLVQFRDSLQVVERTRRFDALAAEYEMKDKERTIAHLEKEKLLNMRELQYNMRELELHRLEGIRSRQSMILLQKEMNIQELNVARNEATIREQHAASTLRQKTIASLQQERTLQAEILDRETSIRNLAVIGAVLILIIASLLFKRSRDKKRSSELRAEAAEYRARSLEVEAMEMRAESELKERQAQESFSRRLMESQEEERANLAYELHDTLCQDLIVAKNALAMSLEEDDARERVHDGINAITMSLDAVRRLSRDLRPFQIDEYGVSSALRSMLQRLDENTPLHFTWDIDSIDGVFAKEQEITMFRITQEGINNILKHAEASEVSLQLKRNNGTVHLVIKDNGRGFDTVAAGRGGFGITGIRQRVRMLGGEMHISSQPGVGTTLELHMPTPERSEEMMTDEGGNAVHA